MDELGLDLKSMLESLLRWLHVIVGILWLGHLYFFNFVNAQFAATMDAETKRKVVPELMPRALTWFRWGALLTWVTGLFLLVLVFYHGKQALGTPDAKWGALQLAMLLLTFLGVFAYDFLVQAALKTGPAQFWGGFVLICGALYGYHAAGFSMRGWSIHLGALFGTIMAFNVWFRIWPAQKRIILAVKAGEKPHDADPAVASARSRHNTYLSLPLLFLMLNSHGTWTSSLSEHFPILTAVIVLLGFGLTAHLYMIAKRLKGF